MTLDSLGSRGNTDISLPMGVNYERKYIRNNSMWVPLHMDRLSAVAREFHTGLHDAIISSQVLTVTRKEGFAL